MGKGKLAKFADMEQYPNVFQCPFSAVKDTITTRDGNTSDSQAPDLSDCKAPNLSDSQAPDLSDSTSPNLSDSTSPWYHEMRGCWHETYFHNQNPIVLELGCGKGEYAVELARNHPEKNFIGVDIKGARMWTGATQALNDGLKNVAFLRTNIEIIDRFFAPNEVQEIWLTFSDPQMKNPRKRLSSTFFMERYRHFLSDSAIIHLKTDSNFLFTYTALMVNCNHLPLLAKTTNLYADMPVATFSPVPPPTTASPISTPESSTPTIGPAGNPATKSAAHDVTTPAAFPAEFLLSQAASIQTYYEQMWLSRGITIKYLCWQLPHATLLEEPNVEIELDDYRSYHRTTRSPLKQRK